jgi:hypothetical protein
MHNPSPLRGEGNVHSRSEWDGDGIHASSHTVHLYILVIGSFELTFGILLTFLMSTVLRDQWHDEDAWSALYIGVAWIVVPLAGILASWLSRSLATRSIVLMVLVGAALVFGGLLVV